MSGTTVLVADDDAAIRFAVSDFLESHGYRAQVAETCAEVERAFREAAPDIAILDYKLPDGNALEMVARLKESAPAVPLVLLTAHASVDLAVRAIKEGAENFLTKPIELPALLVVLERALENQRNRRHQLVRRTRDARRAIDPFRGSSAAVRRLHEEARKLAATDSPVLIQGETGSGKGVLARWIHDHGPRKDEAFVDLNCAGLSRDLLDSDLFGHEKGAFTGASADKPGLLEVAHRGSVFLDEIGDVDVAVQPKLLKVLEEKRYRRLGDVRDRKVDIRLIAATHQDLHGLIVQGRFRSDLFFRISTLPLAIPPLRERVEDIPTLAADLLAPCAADLARSPIRLSADAMAALQSYSWPGNIRELRNVLERAALLCEGDVLSARDLRFQSAPAPAAPLSGMTLDELERLQIDRVVREEHGRVAQASRRLGISRGPLYQKIKKYGIVQFES
jgi:DNA-binding NtrC family response regulator